MKIGSIATFLVLFTFNIFSQKENFSNGYFVVKANVSFFQDSDHKRFERGNPGYEYYGQRGYFGPFLSYTEERPFRSIFPGGEINYYLSRSTFFGFNLGVAFSYDKTFYSIYSTNAIYNGSSESYQRINTNGKGCLKNTMFKFIYGFNFNSKSGFNIYIQPLNPELRFIQTGNSFITSETREVLFSKKINYNTSRSDSMSTLIASERVDIEFTNYKTRSNIGLCFPALLGLEQKFKIKQTNYVAGISTAFSILDEYAVFRVYFGICFGDFKSQNQPGY